MKNLQISIIGDGLTGLVTALSMANLNLKVDVYWRKNEKKNNIKDERVTAISKSNLNFLIGDLGLQKKLFYACKGMNLFYEFEKKYHNFLNYENKDKNPVFIFENSKIKNNLIKKIKSKKNINISYKNISNINIEKSYVKYNKTIKLYDLIILCLGKNSKFYDDLISKRSISKTSNEVAVTASIKHNLKIDQAKQYFLEEGPLAILPYHEKKFSLVWTLNKKTYLDNASNIKEIIDLKIRKIFNYQSKIMINNLETFPINFNLKTEYYKKNTLVLGDGIHSIHPIAGQGFNLVLRDIKKLKDLTKEKTNLGLQIKNSNILNNFYNLRKPENIILGLGIEMTNSFFKKNRLLDPLKKLALKNVGKNYLVKKFSQFVSDKGLIL
ncbi:MAG: hypothetical protein CBE47_00160 [Pelagibacteraceae bacterium TMED287]|nr:MAG: hypothetical protein CBE47_00160 [Pelagibacteraceae bacterium TMED287]